jgi:hypothetical protein
MDEAEVVGAGAGQEGEEKAEKAAGGGGGGITGGKCPFFSLFEHFSGTVGRMKGSYSPSFLRQDFKNTADILFKISI